MWGILQIGALLSWRSSPKKGKWTLVDSFHKMIKCKVLSHLKGFLINKVRSFSILFLDILCVFAYLDQIYLTFGIRANFKRRGDWTRVGIDPWTRCSRNQWIFYPLTGELRSKGIFVRDKSKCAYSLSKNDARPNKCWMHYLP